jgi:hypothetical protein
VPAAAETALAPAAAARRPLQQGEEPPQAPPQQTHSWAAPPQAAEGRAPLSAAPAWKPAGWDVEGGEACCTSAATRGGGGGGLSGCGGRASLRLPLPLLELLPPRCCQLPSESGADPTEAAGECRLRPPAAGARAGCALLLPGLSCMPASAGSSCSGCSWRRCGGTCCSDAATLASAADAAAVVGCVLSLLRRRLLCRASMRLQLFFRPSYSARGCATPQRWQKRTSASCTAAGREREQAGGSAVHKLAFVTVGLVRGPVVGAPALPGYLGLAACM